MASKSDLIEIRMKLLGAKEVAEGTGVASKGIKSVGTSARRTTAETTKASKATSVLTSGYSKLGKAARYGVGFLGVGGAFALHEAVTNTEELSKATTGLNRNFGLSVQESSRWAGLAHARGMDMGALTMAMSKVGKTFIEANRKGGTARTSLNQLGITQNETAKGAHNMAYALRLVEEGFGRAKGGPERQSAALGVLGKGYKEVLPLFAEGRKGLEEQLHWADKYGVTLSSKTNKAMGELVTASRQNKMAMFGLQVQATEFLTPAIGAADDQLQEFLGTLSSKKLTGEQKITAIQHQFEGLEDTLITTITAALPKVAEAGGALGLKLAGALWTGFKNSSVLGKLVIGAWLIKAFGGFSVIGAVGARVGAKLATSLGWKFLETVAPYFAAEAGVEGLGAALGSQMVGLTAAFTGAGTVLGVAMGGAAVAALGGELYWAWKHKESLFGPDLIFTPKTSFSGFEAEDTFLTEHGYDVIKSWPGNIIATDPHGKKEHFHYKHNKWVPSGGSSKGNGGPSGNRSNKRHGVTDPRGRPRAVHHQPLILHVDGKAIAEGVLKYAEDDAAMA